MGRPIARVFGVCALVLVVVLLSLLFAVLRQTPPAPAALPRPNGYDDLVKAGSLVASDVSGYATLTQTQLASLVATNAEALGLARTGLSRQCQVPVDLPFTSPSRMQNVAWLKRLSQLLVAEGRLAELEQRPAQAAEAYLSTIRLGQELSRGGIMIDSLVGIAVEANGLTALQKLLPTLDATQCKSLAEALETAEAKRPAAQSFIDTDYHVARMTFGWRFAVVRIVGFRTYAKTAATFKARYASTELRARQLMLALAGRAYELEKARRPQTPGELVSGYLKSIPQDPVSGSNLVTVP